MNPQKLPKTAPKAWVASVPVWLLAAVVTAVLLSLGIGWSVIM
jgi:hypothetical protein